MNETDIARQIAAGEVESPLKFSNVWLVNLRITGTGLAYRTALKEHVWRNPDCYLNDEFLARCNGLPVVINHPDSLTLTDEYFRANCVGSVLLPYVKGDEVWAVCRIYDEKIVERILTEEMSTSPGVSLGPGNSVTISGAGEESILLENEPRLLDHIALVTEEHGARGVWDRGGEPSGIAKPAMFEDLMMDKEELKELLAAQFKPVVDSVAALSARVDSVEQRETARADAEEKARTDAAVKAEAEKLRADAQAEADKLLEQARADAEKIRADAQEEADKKADSEEEEDKKADEDDKKADSEEDKARNDSDEEALAAAQSRADAAMSACGLKTEMPFSGENPMNYRRRVLRNVQKHSEKYKDLDVRAITDSAAMDIIEREVFADAQESVSRRISETKGSLVQKVRNDSGRVIREYYGDVSTWLNAFKPASMIVMDTLNTGSNKQ